MEGTTYIPDFLTNHNALFTYLVQLAAWDNNMAARRTASYGVAYNYSQMTYPYQPFLPELEAITVAIENTLGFKPNNCLINNYLVGKSKMGYHSDQTDILVGNTGIVIISLGEMRTLRFGNIRDKTITEDYTLPAGSLVYMTQALQQDWQHAIPPSDTDEGRISLTLREIKE